MIADPPVVASEKLLTLTQDEAFALLEMCTLTLAIESPMHLQVLARVGELCRETLALSPADEPTPAEKCPPLSVPARLREPWTMGGLYVSKPYPFCAQVKGR